MKKILNKVCVIGLIITILCNILLPQYAYATDSSSTTPSSGGTTSSTIQFDNEAISAEEADMVPVSIPIPILGGVIELLLDAIKLLIVLPGMIINGVNSGIGGMEGNEGETFISLYNILFNQLGITDINILEFSWGTQQNAIDANSDSAVATIRRNIAYWYYGIRNLAIVILLCVLIYIGIRMAISTIAEDRARYKQLLMYWFTAVVLVFVLHYIILLTININTALVSIIGTAAGSSNYSANMEAYNGLLLERAFGLQEGVGWKIINTLIGRMNNIPASFGAAILYTILNGMTFAFLMLYIRRMIILSFLILIAPIITITYPIDKVGDGKSQALNTWLKEFMFTVLIQPFHCLIFVIFVSTAMNLLNGTFASTIFAIVTVTFLFQAEGIVKKIFGFQQASTLGDAIKSAAAITAGTNLVKSIASKAGSSMKTGSSGSTSSNTSSANSGASGSGGSNSGGTSTNGTASTGSGSGGTGSGNSGTGTSNSGGRVKTWLRAHPKTSKALKTGLKGYAKVGKFAFAAGVASLGAGTGNFMQTTTAAIGVNEAINSVGNGMRARRYAKNLNNDLYLAGNEYDARVQALIDSGLSQNQAHAQLKADITRLIHTEIGRIRNTEPQNERLATILHEAVTRAEQLGKEKPEEFVFKQVTGGN